MSDKNAVRTPANQNPWYVLMTLYGEQDGEDIDSELHELNREAWNIWAGFVLPEVVRSDCITRGVALPDQYEFIRRGDEIRTLHKSEMLRRNGPDYTYPGFPEPSRTAVINFLDVDFSCHFCAADFVFPVDARFYSATFSGDATFDSATFSGDALFRSATFSGYAAFGLATFSGDATFYSATFSGDAQFDSVTFSGDDATFHSATFSGDASFDSVTFSTYAHFDSSTFNGFTYFPETQFGAPGANHPVAFTDCQFLKPTSFRQAVFHSHYPDLSGAVLHDKTEFTAKPENWPVATGQNPEDAKAACARIRHVLGKQGLPEEEHFFYRREMDFACRIGSFWDRLPYRLFGLLSGFGYSIQRPVEALLLLWVYPAVCFFGHAQNGRLADYPEIGRALALSLANIFNFLGFHRTFFAPDHVLRLPAALQLLSGFQTLAGLPLLFFFGLGLRTRFRLR